MYSKRASDVNMDAASKKIKVPLAVGDTMIRTDDSYLDDKIFMEMSGKDIVDLEKWFADSNAPLTSPNVSSLAASCDTLPTSNALTCQVQSTPRSIDEVTTKNFVIVHEWNLGDGLFASIQRKDYKLYVHFRRYFEDIGNQPIKSSVFMNIATFCDFRRKLPSVNTKYVTSSVICNNQLAVFSKHGELTLHQIFPLNDGHKLKLNPLSLNYFEVVKIRELICDVAESIKEYIFDTLLPSAILEKSTGISTSHLDVMNAYFSVLKEHHDENVHELFHCEGCKIDHPSQRRHDCLMLSTDEKYWCVGDDALLLFNVYKIIQDLTDRDVINCFTRDFFDNVCYDDVRKKLIPY